VENTGARIHDDLFAAGCGSTFAYAILDTELRKEMTEDEAITLGIKAIRHARFRAMPLVMALSMSM
jgi:20S proteasome subunit beta 5